MSVSWNSIPREDLKPFLAKSNWQGWYALATNWGMVVAAFALVMWHPSWYTVLPAMIVLGGRQLGLGILTHECAHRTLFAAPALCEWVGNWLCGAPVFVDLAKYRSYHMTHHMNTGTDKDPDIGNYANYPVSKASLLRKFGRDLAGRSGVRTMLGLVKYYGLRSMWRSAVANLVLLGLCWAAGHAWAYLLWPASWMTFFMLFSRIRNAAEHAALAGTRSEDMWANTRTVRAAWWERLTVAPNRVNFHFEHHLAPTVPAYRLPALHRWLVQQGAYERATMEPNYWQVLRRMTQQAAQQPA